MNSRLDPTDVLAPGGPGDPSYRVPSRGSRYFRELCVAGTLVVLLAILAAFAPHFYRKQALLSLVTAQVPALVVAIGIACVMLCRQIDISVGSQFGVCCVLAGLLAANDVSLPVVAVAAIAAGGVMGALNGVLVAILGLPSIVVTLATMVTWAEALRLYQKGQFVNLPTGMQWFGFVQEQGQWALIGIGFAILAVMAWVLKNLNIGRFAYAVGSDAESARLAGINPKRTTLGAFVFLGMLSGAAAILHVVQSPQVDPKSGMGLELRAIAAAVVGGVAVSGGRGNLWGVAAGLLVLATVNPALTYLHVEAYWEKAIQGTVILLAVIADGLRSRGART